MHYYKAAGWGSWIPTLALEKWRKDGAPGLDEREEHENAL
jgi:hypothetical protein